MSVEVTIAGTFTTVQDAGRFGYQSKGIGTNGCMDMSSYEKANALVGNTNGEAVLELTLFGGSFLFHEEAVIALTGALMDMKVNNKLVERNRPIKINAGDELSIGFAKKGLRGYLAIAGGFDVEIVMGSRSTNIKCKMGGYEGRILQKGDRLPIGKAGKSYEELKDLEAEEVIFERPIVLHVIEGPQDDYFTEKGKKAFFETEYTVSDSSDRMGYRLEGEAIESIDGTDIISDGIALGSVQVPANGLPIILLSDRQTTGGYAKIATVISEDIPKIAQALPGEKICFQKVNL